MYVSNLPLIIIKRKNYIPQNHALFELAQTRPGGIPNDIAFLPWRLFTRFILILACYTICYNAIVVFVLFSEKGTGETTKDILYASVLWYIVLVYD